MSDIVQSAGNTPNPSFTPQQGTIGANQTQANYNQQPQQNQTNRIQDNSGNVPRDDRRDDRRDDSKKTDDVDNKLKFKEKEKELEQKKLRKDAKLQSGQLEFTKPLGFNNMTADELDKYKQTENDKFIHQITVPVSEKDISSILDNYRESSLVDDIDDKIASMSARLKSIHTSYVLEDTNADFRTTSVERKAQQLFGKDLKSTHEVFIEDIKNTFKEIPEFFKTLFYADKGKLYNRKYVIFAIVLFISYSTINNPTVSLLRIIPANIFLIGSIIYALFKFTDGTNVFFGNIQKKRNISLVLFCITLLVLTILGKIDKIEPLRKVRITAQDSTEGEDSTVGAAPEEGAAPEGEDITGGAYFTSLVPIPILKTIIFIPAGILILINYARLYSLKLLSFKLLLLWSIITVLYMVDWIINAEKTSVSNLIWCIIFPSLLLLLNQSNRLAQITAGIFFAIFIHELFHNDIENILF